MQITIFQNCSNHLSTEVDARTPALMKSDGNGHGYGGKVGQLLYRFVPNFHCATETLAPETIFWDENGLLKIIRTDVSKGCEQKVVEADESRLIGSPFQDEFFIYNDFLFTAASDGLKTVPSKLAEVLCRDNFASPTIEIVGHYDGVESKAQVQFFGMLANISKDKTDVARLFSSKSVVYQSPAYRMEVEIPSSLEQKSPGQFPGKVQIGSQQIGLSCVLGGGLDISLFSFRKLSDRNLLQSFLNSNRVDSSIELPNSQGQYLVQFEGQSAPSLVNENGEVVDLSQSLLRECENCRNIKVNPTNNQFIAFGYDSDEKISLFTVDLDKKQTHKLKFPIDDLQDYWVLRRSAYFLWKNSLTGHYSLSRYDFETRQNLIVLDEVRYDLSFANSIYAQGIDKFFIYGRHDSEAPLIVVDDRIGAARVVTGRELNIPMAINDKYHFYNVWSGLKQVANTKYMMIPVRKSLNLNNFDTDIYFLDSETLSLSKKWTIPSFFSRHLLDQGKYLMGCNSSYGIYADCLGREDKVLNLLNGEVVNFSAGPTGIINTNTGPVISPLSNFVSFNSMVNVNRYIAGGNFIYGAGLDVGRQYAMSIQTKEVKKICSEFNDDIFFTYFKTHSHRVYQFSINSLQKTLSIYLLNGFECRLQLRVPIDKELALKAFDVIEAGVLLVFGSLSNERDSRTRQKVVFAPFNGRMPIHLNAGSEQFTSAERVLLGPNGTTMYLIGIQMNNGNRSIWEFRPY